MRRQTSNLAIARSFAGRVRVNQSPHDAASPVYHHIRFTRCGVRASRSEACWATGLGPAALLVITYIPGCPIKVSSYSFPPPRPRAGRYSISATKNIVQRYCSYGVSRRLLRQQFLSGATVSVQFLKTLCIGSGSVLVTDNSWALI
jgi:hypothetical protein